MTTDTQAKPDATPEETQTLPTLEEAFGPSAVAAKDLIAQANDKIKVQNNAVKWLRENSQDKQELVDNLKSGETENDQLKAILERREKVAVQLEKIDAQLLIDAEKIATEILAKDTDEEAVAKHTESYENAVKNVRDIKTALKTIFGEKVFDYLDETQTLKRKSAGSPGSGPPRLRGMSVKVDGVLATKKMGAKQEVKSSFGAAAEKIGNISVKTLVEAYQKSVGTTDSTKYPTDWHEFEVVVEDKTYKVEAKKEAE